MTGAGGCIAMVGGHDSKHINRMQYDGHRCLAKVYMELYIAIVSVDTISSSLYIFSVG